MPSTQSRNNQLLGRLFGSRTRIKLLILLLSNPERQYFVREITRRLNERINSIRRELSNFEKMGLVKSINRKRKRYYYVDTDFIIYRELRDLILRVATSPEDTLYQKIKDVGTIKVAILTGRFTGAEEVDTDLLIVGKPDREKLDDFVKLLEAEISQEINFTIIPPQELNYRIDMGDHFIGTIIDNHHLSIVDTVDIVKKRQAFLKKRQENNSKGGPVNVKKRKFLTKQKTKT
jgi:DNA-binding MarR family transcriptional regulator